MMTTLAWLGMALLMERSAIYRAQSLTTESTEDTEKKQDRSNSEPFDHPAASLHVDSPPLE